MCRPDEYIKGRRHSLDPRNRLAFGWRLVPPADQSLDTLLWDAPHGTEILRVLIVDMLDRGKAGVADLIRLWQGRQGLRREDFVARVRESFFHDAPADLWEAEVQAVADSVRWLELLQGQPTRALRAPSERLMSALCRV